MTIDPSAATAQRSYPSISLIVPLDGHVPWRERLAHLHLQAVERLHDEFGGGVDAELLRRLAATVDDTEPPPGARSLGVYVNGEIAAIVGIDVEVRERTVIDDTFATRDLVAGDLRVPRYWLLALSLDDPRLLRGHGSLLDPVPLDRSRVTRADGADAPLDKVLRTLDDGLDAALDGTPDPLVVMGAEPIVSTFLARTRHVGRVEGVVRRTPVNDPAALAAAVAPTLGEVSAERRAQSLATLSRAVAAGTAATGLEEAWRAAHREPGLLLVEATYEQPVRRLPRGGIAPTADPTPPAVVDDGVDDLIEAVLARDGRVELLPDGSLAAHRRIAFVAFGRRR